MQAETGAEAVRALFSDVIPALQGHRLAPLSATPPSCPSFGAWRPVFGC